MLSLPACSYAAPDTYKLDKDHTHIVFFVNHEGFSDMIGRFKAIDGSFAFSESEPEKSTIDVTIKAASIDTDVAALNKVLVSKAFFNADAYPTLHFKSDAVKVTGRNTGDVLGELTMLGVTRPVALHVIYNKSGIHPFTNNYVSGFTAKGTLDRLDFGMNAYPKDIGTRVHFIIEVEGIDPLRHPGNVTTPH
jgi:polyisoprenoid-binding protein YceI